VVRVRRGEAGAAGGRFRLVWGAADVGWCADDCVHARAGAAPGRIALCKVRKAVALRGRTP
jgi:hypothetical protein